MPINQPVPGRKIAPASLAFDPRRRRGGTSVSTYQGETQEIVNITINNIMLADTAELRRSIAASQVSERDAELRAKHYVGDWHQSYLWTVSQAVTLTHGTIEPVSFQNEVIRCQGVNNDRRLFPSRNAWRHVVQPGQQGTWWIYASLSLTTPDTIGFVTRGARMYVTLNGGLYHMIDWIAADTYNETDLETIKLAGGTNVYVAVGDTIEVEVLLETTGVGPITFGYDTSVFGYVTGQRTSCDYSHINAPTTGVNFDTTP